MSTAKQGEGVSLEVQREAIERYAATNNLNIVDWFEEKESAAKQGRRVFSRMLLDIGAGKADGIIVHKIDRSARNLKDWAAIGDLIDSGVQVHFAHEGLDLHSRSGRLSADIQAVIAADYIRNLREETRKGFYGRLKQGLYPLGAPLGYLDQGSGQVKIPDPEKAQLVKSAFEMYASGRYSFLALLKELHRKGLRSRKDGKLTKNSLTRILRNPFYIGLIRIGTTGETFSGVHQPLISKSLYDEVQRVLDGRAPKAKRIHDFAFRRLLSCGICNRSLIGEKQKGNVYYRCHNKHDEPTSVREDAIEVHLQSLFIKIQLKPTELPGLVGRITRYRKQIEKEQENHIASMQIRLGKLNDRLDRLTDAYIDGGIDKQVFEKRKEGILYEQKDLDEQLKEHSQGENSVANRMLRLVEHLKSVYLLYKSANLWEKREIVKRVSSNRYVTGKNLVVELRKLYDHLANRQILTYCAPHRDTSRTFSENDSAVDNLFSALQKYCIAEKDNEERIET